jgi:hypothetical protein
LQITHLIPATSKSCRLLRVEISIRPYDVREAIRLLVCVLLDLSLIRCRLSACFRFEACSRELTIFEGDAVKHLLSPLRLLLLYRGSNRGEGSRSR